MRLTCEKNDFELASMEVLFQEEELVGYTRQATVAVPRLKDFFASSSLL